MTQTCDAFSLLLDGSKAKEGNVLCYLQIPTNIQEKNLKVSQLALAVNQFFSAKTLSSVLEDI